jgi:hypothetical protein
MDTDHKRGPNEVTYEDIARAACGERVTKRAGDYSVSLVRRGRTWYVSQDGRPEQAYPGSGNLDLETVIEDWNAYASVL